MYLYLLCFLVCSSSVFATILHLSPTELDEVNKRIELFYSENNTPSVMNRPTLKYDIREDRVAHPNPQLAGDRQLSQNPLAQLAGKKLSKEFKQYRCEKFLKPRFPQMDCDSKIADATWSTFQTNDKLSDLTKTWIDNPTYQLDEIPTSGSIENDAWSDDYWRTRWGQTSYRYGLSEFNRETTYNDAISSYQSETEWNFLGQTLLPLDISKKILFWSPAEKYDLTVGDETFSLTRQQKTAGASSVDSEGNVENWFGICHGWAPAALMAPRPTIPVTTKVKQNIDVTWFPNDIKAMVSLSWANGNYTTNFIGGRCELKEATTLPNGRIKDQSCFDSNPATFHLALGNMIGKAKAGFVFDKSFDYEVWNQPVIAYETLYFNPLNTNSRSYDWRKVAVPYDRYFKQHDRFQHPLSRGRWNPQLSGYDDSKIQYIVGAITTVVYLAEIRPNQTLEIQEDKKYRETYTYDLEIEAVNGRWAASGGEWHENSHPDFLWVPQKGSVPKINFDQEDITFSLSERANAQLTATAQKASPLGSPLCKVIKALLAESTGTDTYHCE
ncbi:hypothetical protein EBQ74_04220 [bacterium]|nr:hypothetical protein [bacterium]